MAWFWVWILVWLPYDRPVSNQAIQRCWLRYAMGRVLIYFLLLVLMIVVPVTGALALAVLGPQPYLLAEGGLPAAWEQERPIGQGGRVLATRHETPEQARAALEQVLARVPHTSLTQTPYSARYSDGRRHGLLLPVEHVLVHLSAPSAAQRDALLQALPFVRENPEPGRLWLLLERQTAWAIAALVLYMLSFGLLMIRGASWAAQVRPAPGTPVDDARQLRARLLAVNDMDVPYTVQQQADDTLLVSWRVADSNALEPGGHDGVRYQHQLRLALDESSHTVRAVQDAIRHDSGSSLTRLVRQVRWRRSIDFWQWDAAAAMGLHYRPGTGWVPQLRYRYVYDSTTLRSPFISATLGSGWTWRPVLGFWRALCG